MKIEVENKPKMSFQEYLHIFMDIQEERKRLANESMKIYEDGKLLELQEKYLDRSVPEEWVHAAIKYWLDSIKTDKKEY